MKTNYLSGIAGLVSWILGMGSQQVDLPMSDSFYQMPSYSSLQKLKPGAIIKSRAMPHPVPGDKAGSTMTDLEGWQIMYRSQNTHGQAIASITTVVVPKTKNTQTLKRVVSYQFAEDSSYAGCAPSIALQKDGIDDFGRQLLKYNVALVIPDHEGPNSAFGAGILEGQLTLDSIRAALNSHSITKLDPAAKVVMAGYSGGSIPTGWAAQIQPNYAPELHSTIVGAAVGGFVTNLTATLVSVNKRFAAGFAPAGVIGLCGEYPDFARTVYSDLHPAKAREFLQVTRQCSTKNLLGFLMRDIFAYFKHGSGILQMPAVRQVLSSLVIGASAPSMPMFVYQGTADEIVDINAVDATVSQWCTHGAGTTSIEYTRLPKLNHISASGNGQDAAIKFLINQLDSPHAHNVSGCSIATRLLSSSKTHLQVHNAQNDPGLQFISNWHSRFGQNSG